MSRRDAARSVGVSPTTVDNVLARATAAGLASWASIAELSEEDLGSRLHQRAAVPCLRSPGRNVIVHGFTVSCSDLASRTLGASSFTHAEATHTQAPEPLRRVEQPVAGCLVRPQLRRAFGYAEPSPVLSACVRGPAVRRITRHVPLSRYPSTLSGLRTRSYGRGPYQVDALGGWR